MRRRLLSTAVIVASVLMYGPAVNAQAPSIGIADLLAAAEEQKPPPAQREVPPPPRPTVNLTAEQHHIIKEIIKEIMLKDQNITKAANDVDVSIGALVPRTVTVWPFPALVTEKVPQVRAHSYFVKGEQVIVVDPKDNRIADVID